MIQNGNRESSHNKTSKSKLLVYTSNFSLEFALDFVICQSNILPESRLKSNMILPTLKISHSQYFSWHLSASQATIPAGGADTAGARAWLLIGRCGAWGWSQLSALGSKTLPCVKNYIRVEKRGLVACWSSGEALAVLEKWRGVVISQAGCGGAVVLLAPELQQHNSGCVAQLFHCGSVVSSCYVATARFFLATKN